MRNATPVDETLTVREGTPMSTPRKFIVRVGLALVIFIALLPGGCKNESLISPAEDTPGFPNQSPAIDLDGDGTIDIELVYRQYHTTDVPISAAESFLNVEPLKNHQVQYSFPEGSIPMQDSMFISDTTGWTSFGTSIGSIHWSLDGGWDSAWSGTWIGLGDRSLGVRLRKNDSYHYAWVKLSVHSRDGQFTVIDHAYNALPNTAIRAGIHP